MGKLEKPFIWLASYPKSGNTWMRFFIQALKNGSESVEKLMIKNDDFGGIASARDHFDQYLGVDSSELHNEDIQQLRCQVYRLWASELKKDKIVKVHDAAFFNGIQIFPVEVTKKAIYIIRNPFDVAASYASHMGVSIEEAVRDLCSGRNKLVKNNNRFTDQVVQYMGSWSDHYNSWKNLFHNDNFYLVRYEDMLAKPEVIFPDIVAALGWEYSHETIMNAVDATRFDRLKELEAEKGFHEKSNKGEIFFRNGKSGGWREEISEAQAQLLVNRHYHTLLELDYINDKGEIII